MLEVTYILLLFSVFQYFLVILSANILWSQVILQYFWLIILKSFFKQYPIGIESKGKKDNKFAYTLFYKS